MPLLHLLLWQSCTTMPLMELQYVAARPDDVVLLDGMLPNLQRFIARTYSRCPGAHIIVVTDVRSFSIYYEVLRHGGATYFSGPMTAEQFVETIREITEYDEIYVA